MTQSAFRRIAVGLSGVTEHAHHGHADFLVGSRIFATLIYVLAERSPRRP